MGSGGGGLKAEDEVILLCARTDSRPPIEARLRNLLSGPLDWDTIERKARAHHVTPLLFNTLQRFEASLPTERTSRQQSGPALPPETISAPDTGPTPPPVALGRLRAEFLQNATRNLLAREELLRILQRLQEAGIRAMPFKGPTLAESVYGHLSLRVFGDLDILVPPDQVWQAREALEPMGYRPIFPMNRGEERLYLRSDCEVHLSRPMPAGGASVVELHWNLLPRAFAVPLSAEMLWRDAAKVEVGGVRYERMSLENEVIAGCLHAWKHFWIPLQSLCDLRELIARAGNRIDWKEVRSRAKTLRIERVFSTSLAVVRHLFGGDPGSEKSLSSFADERSNAPSHLGTGEGPAAQARLGDNAMDGGPLYDVDGLGVPAGSLPTALKSLLFPNDRVPDSLVAIHRFYAGYRERLDDRIRYGWRVLATPTTTDFRELALPARLWPLYWPLRPLRLAGKVLSRRQKL